MSECSSNCFDDSNGTDTLRFFQKQSLRNTIFETLFFKSVADTLQTLFFAIKVFVFETPTRYTTDTLFRK